jgi:hypothetical protein
MILHAPAGRILVDSAGFPGAARHGCGDGRGPAFGSGGLDTAVLRVRDVGAPGRNGGDIGVRRGAMTGTAAEAEARRTTARGRCGTPAVMVVGIWQRPVCCREAAGWRR